MFQGNEAPQTTEVPLTVELPQTTEAPHTTEDPQTTEVEATLVFPWTSETVPVCGLKTMLGESADPTVAGARAVLVVAACTFINPVPSANMS